MLTSCEADPPPALVGVLERMAAAGIEIGDVLADSGYAHRKPESWALPLRRLGARLIQDLHPHDRGPKGTHMGATLANGALYCPATPSALLELGPLASTQSSVSCQAALYLRRFPNEAVAQRGARPLANPGERLTADQTDHGAAVRSKREDERRSKVKTSQSRRADSNRGPLHYE
jgi:hypothetical protein